MEPKTHECSRSLGRLLGRAAVVSAIDERIELIGSSTKEARLFHKSTAKSRPNKNCCSVGKLVLFTKEMGEGGNPRATTDHCASDRHEERSQSTLPKGLRLRELLHRSFAGFGKADARFDERFRRG
jgi:hypothetical protein